MNSLNSIRSRASRGDSAPIQIANTGAWRRKFGLTSYVLFFLLVAAVLLLLFFRFTGSAIFAAGLVGFMVAYMGVMGWLASRGERRRR